MQASYDLFNLVIQQSQSKNWSEAVLEWEVIDCTEDETCSTECLWKRRHQVPLYHS